MKKDTIRKIKKSIDIILLVTACFVLLQQLIKYEAKKAALRYQSSLSKCNLSTWHFYHLSNEIKKEIIGDYVDRKIARLKQGVDEKSLKVLDCISSSIKAASNKHVPIITTDLQREHFPKFRAQFPNSGKFPLDEGVSSENYEYFLTEVAYFHHSLRFADQKIKDYVRSRDVLDIGACSGESMVVLKKYTDKTVYCFEFSKKSIERFRSLAKFKNISGGYKLIEKGVSDRVGRVSVCDTGDGTDSITNDFEGGDKIDIDLTTIDIEAKKYNMNVGFIKADAEGHAMPIVRGAINTIKACRPVLCLSIYHNIEEFFEIKPFLEQNLENYIYEFRNENFLGCMSELVLFCYPAEIISEKTENGI